MKAVAGMAAMCGEHGAVEPPWFQALIEMQLKCKDCCSCLAGALRYAGFCFLSAAAACAWQGRRKALQHHRWFHLRGGLAWLYLCYWHFLMCLCKQIFQQKRRKENSAPTYHVWWQVHIIGIRCICFYFGPIWTNHDSCTTAYYGVLIFWLLYNHICAICAFLNKNLISILYLYTIIIFIDLLTYIWICVHRTSIWPWARCAQHQK